MTSGDRLSVNSTYALLERYDRGVSYAAAALRRLRDDRRGVTALVMGVSASVVFGMAALAAEGGSWYYLRRNSQNAADTAAHAGAVRLAMASSYVPAQSLGTAQTFARAAATDNALRNRFVNGADQTTVTINTPPVLSPAPLAGDTSAVEVRIQRDQTRGFSRFFTGNTTQTVESIAVARVLTNGNACILGLGLSGQPSALTGSGNPTLNMPNCSIASNATGPTAINFNGNPNVTAASVISAGGCNGCSSTALTYQPATTNPYAYLDSTVFTKGSCTAKPPQSQDYAMPTLTGGTVTFCDQPDVKRTGNANLTLTPGTYIFWNTSFVVTNGTVTCPTCTAGQGITMIFTGDDPSKIGGPQITGGTVTLTAPNSGPYAGILFYRDYRAAAGNCNSPPVSLTGNNTMTLTGAMYFPSSCVKYAGTGQTSCAVLVAGVVDFSGNTNFSTAGCASMNVPVPLSQVVRMVR